MTLVTKTTPWPHQVAGTNFILEREGSGIFYGMGAGKSKTVIDAVRNGDCERILILCPVTMVTEWPRQFQEHYAEPMAKVIPLCKGTTKKKAEQLISEAYDDSRRVVVVVGYESAKAGFPKRRSQPIEGLAKAIIQWAPDMVVCDESQKIKSHNSAASRFVFYLSKIARKRVALTGTPLHNCPLDIFGQARFIDSSVFGHLWGAFKSEYAVLTPWISPSAYKTGQCRNPERLQAKMNEFSLQVKSEDVLDLPELTDVWRWGELAPKTKKAYRSLRDDWVAEFEDGSFVTPANALVKALRLQQVAGGAVVDDEGKVVELPTPKEGMLEEILDSANNEPVVVFGKFKHDLSVVERLCKKRSYFELSGEKREIEDWADAVDNGDKSAVIGVNIQSGGAGVNQLVRSRIGVFYSTGYSLGDYEQARARLHRPGQKKPVTLYHLGAEGTVDIDISKALASKKDWGDQIMSGIRSGRKL